MISSKALIDKKTVMGSNVEIGPYVIIEGNVSLGNNVKISPYVHIKGNTSISDNTLICTGSVIGEASQILGKKGSKGKIKIGKNNIIREYVTINSPSEEDGCTFIGDDNFLMAFSHIAHDCNIANNIVVCNGALVAGHADIQDRVFISGNVVIHQFVKIGRLAIVGGLSRVNQDIPPFMMVVGDSKVRGLNFVGLRRANIDKNQLADIKKAFSILYRKNLSIKNALKQLENIDSDLAREIVMFIRNSKRGICSVKQNSFLEKIFLDYPYFIRSNIITYKFFLMQKNRRRQ